MQDLGQCQFEASYDTKDSTNVVEDFYIPALSNSCIYDRQTGFFTSSSLSIAAEGMINFIKNNGKMRILTSPILTDYDAKVLDEFYNNPNELIEHISDILMFQLDEEFISNDSTEALGWMLANNLLEIRIVLVKNNNKLLSSEEIAKSGIFHNKVGILKDEKGNIVSFSGSIN